MTAPDFTAPPVIAKGGRSLDFAGVRIRPEASRDPQHSVDVIAWLAEAIELRQRLQLTVAEHREAGGAMSAMCVCGHAQADHILDRCNGYENGAFAECICTSFRSEGGSTCSHGCDDPSTCLPERWGCRGGEGSALPEREAEATP